MILDGLISRCTTPHFSAAAECARGLFNHFKCKRERHWTFATNFGLERFALDQFHDVETFAVLLSVMTHTRDVRVMDLRGCSRLAQEARPYARNFRNALGRLP